MDLPDRLAGAPLKLQAPSLVSERYDVVVAMQQAQSKPGYPTHRVLAGALGLCWPRVRQRIPYNGDLVAFGGQVIDLLLGPDVRLSRGDEPPDMGLILRCGNAAVALCLQGVLTEAAVKDASTFSAAPTDDSPESSSGSSDDGGSSRGGSDN